MRTTSIQGIELAIWKEIAGTYLSVSHDRWHIDRVLGYAEQLCQLYGGDPEVIAAAAIMHDLGRSTGDRHGQASIKKSTDEATRILRAVNFPHDKADKVIQAIAEHDQEEVTPSTVEAKILKDADFLAGFGAWGVLRIAMWSGESGRDVSFLLRRLTERMPKRAAHLEFPASSVSANQQMLFTNLFAQELGRAPDLTTTLHKGKYIILEGVSATGKDTQVEILQKRLVDEGHKILRVSEPSDFYRALRDAWQSKEGIDLTDPVVMRHLLLADRHQLIQRHVLPTLTKGETVLSVRSFISTLVYQCSDDHERAEVAFAHRFVPSPDLVLLLDLDVDLTWERIVARKKNRGVYEVQEKMPIYRDLYRRICSKMFGERVRVVDASGSVPDVAEQIWREVSSVMQE